MTLSDDQLLEEARHGRRASCDALFERHRSAVYTLAYSILGPSRGAEEVLQDTFLKALNRETDYTGQGKFRSWLLKIARNKALNRLASFRTQEKVFAQTGFRIVPTASPTPTPAEQAADADLRKCVKGWIQELPREQREALSLHVFEGLKYREVADVTDTAVNTVKTRIRQARRKLAARLKDTEAIT